MFGADPIYHHACLSAYIQKYKRAISVKESGPIRFTKKKIFECYINFIRDVIESGSGISLNDIRDMINDKETIFITNLEVKTYLTDTLGLRSSLHHQNGRMNHTWYFHLVQVLMTLLKD